MLKNYIMVALRTLARHKMYSLINISGLAVGMTVFILIALWVTDELSYDKFHKDVNNLYRIIAKGAYFEDGIDGAPAPLANAIRTEIPDVIDVARVMDVPKLVISYNDKAFYETRIMLTEQPFFNIFSFPFIYGNPENALSNPNEIVITEQIARKYFGEEDPLGKILVADNNYQLTVSGVMKDFPKNSSFKCDIIASLKIKGEEFTELESHWGAFMTVTYIEINPNADIEGIVKKMNEIGEKNNCPQFKAGVSFDLQPFLRVHLDGKNNYRVYTDIGDSLLAYSFSVIAVFVLLIACINFINLSTARSLIRAKEVGLRKAVGARRLQLVRQFLGESILLSAISFFLAVVLVEICLPAFNNLVGKSLDINIFDPGLISGAIAIIIIVGIVAGSYPAFYLSSFNPVAVLKGKERSVSRKSSLRRILVVFQFSLSIALFIGTAIIYLQLNYISTKDLGFDRANIVHIPIKENTGSQYSTIKSELLQSPYIESVSSQYNLEAYGDFSTNGFVWEGGVPNYDLTFNVSNVEPDYFETLRFELVRGRLFSKKLITDTSAAVIINEEAVGKMGLENPVGKRFGYMEFDATIIGVVKNANVASLYKDISPRVYRPVQDFADASEHGKVLIRFSEDNFDGALSHIRNTWEKFNKVTPFEFELLDDTYKNLYRKENKIRIIVSIFTLLAIFISCLGLFGLVSSITERRTKEIGIRKVLGAKVFNIINLLAKDFVVLVAIANLIAWPVAYLIMNRLLQNYPYRINLNLWIFAASALAVLLVAILTVSFQALKAAMSNPVDTLKYE
ncbi:MAG: ABC transporter permease [Candidatus Zixiibacteriota bacterium]|nr:MAG: ABC transporter permease [candidate division Zixibacteria bacterium]